jgi:uncharacterized membrane protein
VIGLGFVYVLMGVLTGGVALVNARDASNPRRWRAATFWGLWALTFLAGTWLPDVLVGVVVIVMALLAGTGGLGQGRHVTTSAEERARSAARLGHRLFVPALLVPAVTVLGTWAFKRLSVGGTPLVEPRQATLVALGTGAVVGLVAAVRLLRPPASVPPAETRRLLDAVGWAAVLPQMLAALGAVFAAAGVGEVVAGLLGRFIPLDVPFVAVSAYTLGMALFTMVMGNAFAAFPVMTAAVGLPVLVRGFGGDPAIVTAIGMLSGFCGTLCTPMAANFNVVPVALLELPDQWSVIRVQAPTALALLATNTGLMYLLVRPA